MTDNTHNNARFISHFNEALNEFNTGVNKNFKGRVSFYEGSAAKKKKRILTSRISPGSPLRQEKFHFKPLFNIEDCSPDLQVVTRERSLLLPCASKLKFCTRRVHEFNEPQIQITARGTETRRREEDETKIDTRRTDAKAETARGSLAEGELTGQPMRMDGTRTSFRNERMIGR